MAAASDNNPAFKDSNWRPSKEVYSYDRPVHRDDNWRPPVPDGAYNEPVFRDDNWRQTKSKRRRSKTPDTRSNSRVGITFITRQDSDTGHALVVESKIYTHPVDEEDLREWILSQHLRHPKRNDEAAILVIEGYSEGLSDMIKRMIPRYPRYLNSIVRDRKLRPPFIPAESGYGQCDVAFVFNHLGGNGHARPDHADVDSADPERETWVGAWIGSIHQSNFTSVEDREYRPLVVLLFPAFEDGKDLNHYGELVTNQYQGHQHLFVRLKFQPLFIFMDLYRMFTRWDLVARRIAKYCQDSEDECFDRVSRVIPRVADLHRNLRRLYLIRQQLHNHELARRRFYSLIDTLPSPRNSRIAVADIGIQKERLKHRLTDIEDEHSDKLLLLDTLKERFQNIVDLEFNVASAKTDVRVAAISVLAFAIAPVGFVASIFGITTMSVPVKWFAVAGSIVAVISIAIWFSIDRYYSNVESQIAGRSLFGSSHNGTGRKDGRQGQGESIQAPPEFDTYVMGRRNVRRRTRSRDSERGFPAYDTTVAGIMASHRLSKR